MPGARVVFVLAVLLAAGCMGPGGSRGPSETPNKPYTAVAVLAENNVEAREPDCDPRPCREYYHIAVWGSENATRVSGPKEERLRCQKSWLFTANNANQTLTYNSASFKPNRDNLKSVITTNFWGATISERGVTEDCPTTYAIDSFPGEFPQSYVRALGSYGAVRFNVYRDGTIAFEEQYFPTLGHKVVVSYARTRIVGDTTYYVRGGFEIVNMGPWPMDQLVGASTGTVTRGPG